MLILMRRIEESVMIGDDIEIKILKISGNQVQLGITAPKHISIYRREIWEQVTAENQKASQLGTSLNKDILSPFRCLRQSSSSSTSSSHSTTEP